jgi:hypothetical protein
LGGSFCGMWYKADMVFISNRGGFFSAISIAVMPRPHTSACSAARTAAAGSGMRT